MSEPTPEQMQMIRVFFAPVADKELSDEECENIWKYGCAKPDADMLKRGGEQS